MQKKIILFFNCNLDLIINMLFYLLLSYIIFFDYNILYVINKKLIKKNKKDNNNLKSIN